MKLIILCFSILSVASCSNLPSYESQLRNTHEIVGAYNHLTLCCALVRNGLQVNSIRRDILGNVKLAQLSPELQQLYQSLLRICDKALAQQEEITQIESSLDEQRKQAKAKKKIQLVSSFLLYCANPNPLALLSSLFSGNPIDSKQMQIAQANIQAMKTAIAHEVSNFEFQLSVKRNKLSQGDNSLAKQFITATDIGEYLDLRFDENQPEAYYSSLALFFQRSPALYFVAYELGKHALSQGQLTRAQQYFGAAVNNTPSILKYNPIRVDARCFAGDVLTQETEYLKALSQYSKALEEDGGSVHGMRGKAFALHLLGRYVEARPFYENCLRIEPGDPTTRYNYACMLALAGNDHNLVLEELRRAFNSGFTEVVQAKSYPDLASLSESQRFKELTEMRIGYDINWNALTPDIFQLSN